MSGRCRFDGPARGVGVLLFLSSPIRSSAGEDDHRRITNLDAAGETLTVTDGTGTGWSFKVASAAEIDLNAFKAGDRVTVTISRATPRNMMSAADILKKGDKVVPAGGY
jgi:hypothetical protein